ncbi:2Fe-2S iron-sulfur cluster-binding protein [Pantoea sp. Aalb]|uniref:2Fe-2S iron-sulfur cluster-binding protein n=1 Tax=Pantoea sp. Aalb TaxID=2576762 RepID=UPI001F31F4BB|nr:2Fe-2S iron-sulfur cluster-binding protein [Pantoea sp. Aalb]
MERKKLFLSKNRHHVVINYKKHEIIGNNKQIILEQLELYGFLIPYSCRSGICGKCKLHLISGTVKLLNKSYLDNIHEDGMIFPCCCIPISNITLL